MIQHTLLPNKERRNLRREYRVRAFSIFLLMVSFSLLVGIGSLFPSFIQMVFEEKVVANTVSSLKSSKESEGLAAKENELRKDQVLISQLLKSADNIRPSAFVDSVISVKGGVKITAMTIDLSAAPLLTMIVQGTAPSRDELLAFKSRLENLIPGNKVDLPISQLAKSSNIQFSLKMIQTIK